MLPHQVNPPDLMNCLTSRTLITAGETGPLRSARSRRWTCETPSLAGVAGLALLASERLGCYGQEPRSPQSWRDVSLDPASCPWVQPQPLPLGPGQECAFPEPDSVHPTRGWDLCSSRARTALVT